ncbi:zinc finger CCCH domain-containing protein 6 [Senna tora]|uniref:Zinc finger CCCH domain-containing protein 6 n=1 Tax=Senna tora TaxID=362788 RepID=A0A834T8H8_9FABA|nr:zinc finger CCCH domain-containing protein 6 [Senna tora]
MRDFQKSKRVSWASDSDICQVRLFLSEESPSQVGLSAQDDLQAKTSLLSHPGGGGSEGILPPGFEGAHPSSQLQVNLSQIPMIRWTNPPKMLLNLTWLVVAGEESKEVEDQNKREMRELEAIYPRTSSIPPNPSVSIDVADSHYTDSQTALIPITPIEDGDAAEDMSSGSMAPFDDSMGSQPPSLPVGVPKGSNSPASVELAHDVAAASLALTNIVHSSEHGNLIDHELLNKILSSPELIEKLVRDYGTVSNSQGVPNARSNPAAFPHPPTTVNQVETSTTSAAFSASASYPSLSGGQVVFNPSQSLTLPAVSPVTVSSSAIGGPPAKDSNYYKSLIQQHGGERQETLPYSGNCYMQQQPVGSQETTHNYRSREQKTKIMKPCIYFNSPRGCRNGVNCAYQHDAEFRPRGSAVPGIQNSKRMKLDSEISS